jgi:hypothetical protein
LPSPPPPSVINLVTLMRVRKASRGEVADGQIGKEEPVFILSLARIFCVLESSLSLCLHPSQLEKSFSRTQNRCKILLSYMFFIFMYLKAEI